MNTIAGLLLMGGQAAGGQPGGGSLTGFLVPMAIIFLVFYFLMIRPQQKQAKKMKAMLGALNRGDEVITRGGIHGRIHGITDVLITLEIADNCRIKINRDQIAAVKTSAEPQSN